MPKEVLSWEQVDRLQEEYKILLECVKIYADEEQWCEMDTDLKDTWFTNEDGFKTAKEALQKIKELK